MPTPASSPIADTEQVYLPKFGALVTVNVADVPYLRTTQGALSPAEHAAQQAAAATRASVPTAPALSGDAHTGDTAPTGNAFSTGDTAGEKSSDSDSQVKKGKPFQSKADKAADAPPQ